MAKKNRNNQQKGNTMPDADQNQSELQQLSQDAAGEQSSNEQSDAPGDQSQQEQNGGDSSNEDTGGDSGEGSGQPPEQEAKEEEKAPATPPVVQETTSGQAPAVVDQGVQDNTKQEEAAPVVQEAKPTVAAIDTTVSAAPALSNFEKLIAKVKAEGSQEQKNLVARLEKYVTDMAPNKPQKPELAISHQYDLWDILNAVVTNPDNEEFRRQWFIVLAFFHQHKEGALGGKRVFRFAEHWRRDQEALTFKQRLINIIHLVCDFENRKEGLKEVDLDRSLEGMFTEAVRNRFIAHLKQ